MVLAKYYGLSFLILTFLKESILEKKIKLFSYAVMSNYKWSEASLRVTYSSPFICTVLA